MKKQNIDIDSNSVDHSIIAGGDVSIGAGTWTLVTVWCVINFGLIIYTILLNKNSLFGLFLLLFGIVQTNITLSRGDSITAPSISKKIHTIIKTIGYRKSALIHSSILIVVSSVFFYHWFYIGTYVVPIKIFLVASVLLLAFSSLTLMATLKLAKLTVQQNILLNLKKTLLLSCVHIFITFLMPFFILLVLERTNISPFKHIFRMANSTTLYYNLVFHVKMFVTGELNLIRAIHSYYPSVLILAGFSWLISTTPSIVLLLSLPLNLVQKMITKTYSIVANETHRISQYAYPLALVIFAMYVLKPETHGPYHSNDLVLTFDAEYYDSDNYMEGGKLGKVYFKHTNYITQDQYYQAYEWGVKNIYNFKVWKLNKQISSYNLPTGPIETISFCDAARIANLFSLSNNLKTIYGPDNNLKDCESGLLTANFNESGFRIPSREHWAGIISNDKKFKKNKSVYRYIKNQNKQMQNKIPVLMPKIINDKFPVLSDNNIITWAHLKDKRRENDPIFPHMCGRSFFRLEGRKCFKATSLTQGLNIEKNLNPSSQWKHKSSLVGLFLVRDPSSKILNCEGSSCYELGLHHESNKHYNLSFQLFKKGCGYAQGKSCYKTAIGYKQGFGVKKSNVDAIRYFNKGCKIGSTLSCNEIK